MAVPHLAARVIAAQAPERDRPSDLQDLSEASGNADASFRVTRRPSPTMSPRRLSSEVAVKKASVTEMALATETGNLRNRAPDGPVRCAPRRPHSGRVGPPSAAPVGVGRDL